MSDLLTPCKTCKKEVSKTAKTCPHCGEANPGAPSTATGCLVIVVIVVVIMILGWFFDDSDTNTEEALTQTVEQQVTSHAPQNMQSVVDALNTHYGIEASNRMQEDACLNERFCEVYANNIQIQSMGYIVSALASGKVSPSLYQQVCSGVFIGLTQGNQELIERAIAQGFNAAAQNGQARLNVLGVDFNVTATSSGLLECSFVKYP